MFGEVVGEQGGLVVAADEPPSPVQAHGDDDVRLEGSEVSLEGIGQCEGEHGGELEAVMELVVVQQGIKRRAERGGGDDTRDGADAMIVAGDA